MEDERVLKSFNDVNDGADWGAQEGLIQRWGCSKDRVWKVSLYKTSSYWAQSDDPVLRSWTPKTDNLEEGLSRVVRRGLTPRMGSSSCGRVALYKNGVVEDLLKEMTAGRCPACKEKYVLTEGLGEGSARVKVTEECGSGPGNARKKPCRSKVKDQRSAGNPGPLAERGDPIGL